MAKVTFSIEDRPDGKVKGTLTPTAETLLKKHACGEGLSSAEAYALFLVRSFLAESKRQGKIPLLIPRRKGLN